MRKGTSRMEYKYYCFAKFTTLALVLIDREPMHYSKHVRVQISLPILCLITEYLPGRFWFDNTTAVPNLWFVSTFPGTYLKP